VPAEVARRAKARGLPVIALAGAIGEGARANLDCGIDAFASIQMRPRTLGEAFALAPDLLRHATEDTMRMVAVGMRLREAAGRDPGANRGLRAVVTNFDAVRSAHPVLDKPTGRGHWQDAVARAYVVRDGEKAERGSFPSAGTRILD
jgi:Glycerate kinase family